MSMDNYILSRLRADATHAITLAEEQKVLQHQGLKGRFRELVINNILSPWLPPYCACGTGMIIQGSDNVYRDSSQDDIVIYDKSLTPPVLVSDQAPEGVFLYNSVLIRTEVKSTVTMQDARDFVASSLEISKMLVNVREGCLKSFTGAINSFLAFGTDLKNDNPDSELYRFIEALEDAGIDPLSGIISSIGIIGRGFWKIGLNLGQRVWHRLDSSLPADRLVWYVGVTSSTCFQLHTERVGSDPSQSLESGIGQYLSSPYSVAWKPAS
jgi:hypothetical protein